jgi:tetrapyrrole methylase family protein/MazG family protein
LKKKITVVGLGPGSWRHLTLEGIETLEGTKRLFLRTEKHPVVADLKARGIEYSCFDSLYNNSRTFEEVYSHIVQVLTDEARKGDLVYAVPGNPVVAETTYYLLIGLCKEKGIEIETVPGMSFLDIIYARLGIDPVKGLQIFDGLQLEGQRIDTGRDCIITQVYDRLTASEVKLALMEQYQAEDPLWVVRAAGVEKEEIIERVPLYRLDRLSYIDYLTSIYIPAVPRTGYGIQDLVEIMRELRGDRGCPWDRKQDHQSLKPYLLEEAYEVLDAIEKKDADLLMEELGDLLLQVIFHAQVAEEESEFDFNGVVEGICEKLIRRHPHVFGDKRVRDSDGALDKWEASKRREKGITGYTKALQEIPATLPSLMRSYKVQQKAALAGFDWDHIEDVLDKVKEEVAELEEVYKSGNMNRIKEELGDLLFAVVNLARFEGIRPELALRETIGKFIQRFKFIEDGAKEMGKRMDEMSLDQMEELWQRAKVHKFNKIDKK